MPKNLMASSNANPVLSRSNRIARRRLPSHLLAWFLLLIFLGVTYLLWRNALNENEQTLQSEFHHSTTEAKQRIEQQMLLFEHLLGGAQGLLAGHKNLGRDEFRSYVDALNLGKNYPGIQALGFSVYLGKNQIKSHLAELRRQGFTSYAIHPDGERDAYSPLIYLEPFAGKNLRAFGYDNYANPDCRKAMERSRDTGLVSLSGKLKLIQEDEQAAQSGFLMWLPVYKIGAAHATIAERRANLKGWVVAAFRMDDLMASIFGRSEYKLDVEIYDGSETSDQALMHDQDKIRRDKFSPNSSFQNISILDIAGHNWTIVLSSLPAFDERLSSRKPQFIALAGGVISILLALIIGVLVSSRERAVIAANNLSHELVERKRAEANMRLAAKVFDTVDTAVLVTDAQTKIIQVNPAFSAITGYTQRDAIGGTPRMLSSGAHPPTFYKKMWDELIDNGAWQGEIFNRRKNGEFYTEWLSINEVRNEEGKITNYIALFSDISERKAAEEHMQNLAHYDPLTGLPNRTLLSDRLQQAITAAKREKSHIALMFIDLDKFKPVNDTLGHHIGDLLLKEVATRMLNCLRESDTAARIGGDEFIVLLPLIEAEIDTLSVAEKIREAISQPFEIAEHTLNISTSIGVAVYPEHGSDEKLLLKNADTAMYYAKKVGRNNVMLFNPIFMLHTVRN